MPGSARRARRLPCWLVFALTFALITARFGSIAVSAAGASPNAALDSSVVRLAGSTIPGLASSAATPLPSSSADANKPVTLTVTLRRGNPLAFQMYLSAVENPNSPSYRHFLSQAQLTAAFGPSQSAYDGVRSWLTSEGFTVTQDSVNRLTLTVKGTRAQAERAFKTSLANYRLDGRTVYANTEDVAVPAKLLADIQSVSGLSDVAQPTATPTNEHAPDFIRLGIIGFQSALGGAVAGGIVGAFVGIFALGLALNSGALLGVVFLFAFLGELIAAQLSWNSLQALYPTYLQLQASNQTTQISPQKVGLLEFDTFNRSDVLDWVQALGGSPSQLNRLNEVAVNGGVPSPGPGESEVLLDIDSVLFMTNTSSANISVYDAPTTTSYEQAFNAMIDDGDTVISNSWASCEDEVPLSEAQAIDSVLAQAEASGVTIINGTGDTGSRCLDGSPNTVAVPADSPHATAVGGSSVSLGPAGTYGSASWWNGTGSTPPTGQGGYGISKDFARPQYQNGFTSTNGRSVPDIVASANPLDGIGVCQADAGGCPDGLLSGGTSLAAPEVAAMVANLNTALGNDVGDLNAALYPLAGTPTFHSAADMASDFAHVGLGAVNWPQLYMELAHTSPGPVSSTESVAFGLGSASPSDTNLLMVPVDGTTQGAVRVELYDSRRLPVSGKTVSLSANSGCHATISAPSGPSNDTTGSVVFTVTDKTIENCTFTATDTTDNVAITQTATLGFVAPSATGASIQVSGPNEVPADGTSQATIQVYLENGLGQPASGKTVQLKQSGSASITQASGQATTGTNGIATFTVTDGTQESVSFSATDVTDGNLPVPGTATVTFYSGTPPTCPAATPAASAGYSAGEFASGFSYNPAGGFFQPAVYTAPCTGVDPAVFDASGNAWAGDFHSGTINVLPPNGGTAGLSNQLPDTTFGANNLNRLAFGKDGSLYALLNHGGRGGTGGQVVQLDPASGAVVRTVLATLPDCAANLTVDPLSGDLFLADDCNGGDYTGSIYRIENPSTASPTLVTYATLPNGLVPGEISFAPDGTIFVAGMTSSFNGPSYIYEVSGTTATQPVPTPTEVTKFTNQQGLGVSVATANNSGTATALYATDTVNANGSNAGAGHVYEIDLTQTPPKVTTIVNPGPAPGDNFWAVTTGPDGCAYVAAVSFIERVGPGSCGSSGNVSTVPSLTLTTTAPASPPTGSPIAFTATLANVASPAGTPIHFSVIGANTLPGLVDAGSNGSATFTYAALHPGTDRVEAVATVNGQTLVSNPVAITWVQGKDTAFLSMNQSPEAGTIGTSVALDANLSDVSLQAPAAIVGAQVTLSLGSQSCQARTDLNGNASCSLTPTGPAGLISIGASYDGNSQYTSAAATAPFTVTSLSIVGPPDTLSLSPGTTKATVDTTVTETATVKDASGNLVADGTKVDFMVTGVTTTSGSATTLNGEASFSYSSSLTGTDTMTAAAEGGNSPSAQVTITWVSPASTQNASLEIFNVGAPSVFGAVTTRRGGLPEGLFAAGESGTPTGSITWSDSHADIHVELRPTALIVSGRDATVFGTTKLSNGQTAQFRLDAVSGEFFGGTARLRLSNGYDSGVIHVISVRISPLRN